MNPDDVLYTKDHEWIRMTGETGTVGITHFAQKELGEVVFVELPKVGTSFDAGEVFGNVESVKAVSQLFIPLSGEVIEINDETVNSPELVNEDPYGKGWLIRIRIKDPDQAENLMSAAEYDVYVAEKAEE